LTSGDGGFDKDGVLGTTSPLTGDTGDGGGGGNMWWSVGSSGDKGVDVMFLPATTTKKTNVNRQIMVFTFISAIIIFLEWKISIKTKEGY